MTDDFIQPDADGFKGSCLDDHLAAGYYRMRSALFTTNQVFVEYQGNSAVFMPVFWLRTVLNQVAESRSSKKIRRKCASFSVTCMPAEITVETEALYSLYRAQINFDHSASCRECMLDEDQPINPFNSRMLLVHDGDLLIAVGYFDIGNAASMAILNFYHPDYKHCSLGKFLLLKTLDFSRELQMLYYYPGYLSTTDPKMDYKLFPSLHAIEVFLPAGKQWMPYTNYSKEALHDYFMTDILGIEL